MKIIRGLDTIGNALILQLLFVVFSIPVVTAAPAAIALQRQWAASRAGEKTTMRGFAREFATAWRGSWGVGILFPIIIVGYVVSLLFWRATEGFVGAVAFGLLLGLGLAASAYYLALLVTVARVRDERWPVLLRLAMRELLVNVPRYIAALVVLIVWFVLVWLSLALLLVGSGIVPAATAHAAGGSWRRRAPVS
ncbi:hypothetical protein [Plantibacter sp. YIM 135249]|uniref:hypothetical protein n=1 Tax=Plantibacter sp. YIM 135249 TaxID=3423918 RepID=UPI003D357230